MATENKTESKAVATSRRPTYTSEQIELGLLAVAHANGNTRQASRELKTGGVKLDHRTLWRWSRERHAGRYESIRSEVLPKIRERAAERQMDIVEAAMGVQRKLVDRLDKEADDLAIRDVPGASRNVAVSVGIHAEKAQLFGGQPTQRIERSLDEVLRSLSHRGVKFVEGEVAGEEDVADAQVVEG
jgi:hypothetical protein